MLSQLVAYAEREGLHPEPGFTTKSVRWLIDLAADGRYLGVIEQQGDVGAKRNRGRELRRVPSLSQPEMKRGGPGTRHFLVDNADVVALLSKRDPDTKLLAKHRHFVALLDEAGRATDMPELVRAAATLSDPKGLDVIKMDLERASPTDLVTLSIGGNLPVESDKWHHWWRTYRASLGVARGRSKRDTKRMRCLASGELVHPSLTQGKIAGLADVGGLPMGDVLAGYKQDSFRSYGLVQAENAAVSAEMSAAYRAALDQLIRKSHRLPNMRVAYWYKDSVPTDSDPLPFLLEGSSASDAGDALRRFRELLTAIETGRRPELAGNRYHLLSLSGASGRVMIRDWAEGPFEQLVRGVASWFEALEIVSRDGATVAPRPKLRAILGALVRELRDRNHPPFPWRVGSCWRGSERGSGGRDLPAPTVLTVWRSALDPHRPIPTAVVAQALSRSRIDIIQDAPFNHARMGLLKAFLVRKGDALMKPALNPSHPSPAYQCGRLLAVLAALQRGAVGDVGAGIVQRYYAAASATPALIVGRLLRLAQFHLGSLRERGGLRHWHEGRIAEVTDQLRAEDERGPAFPTTLTLEEQSLFALGYYQQIAADRADAAARRAGAALPERHENELEEDQNA